MYLCKVWYKKWGGVIIIFAISLIFNSCQKETLLSNDITVNFENEVNNLPVSVDANTLVFETEDDFQEIINFLNNSSDDELDDFEKILNFNSFRKSNKMFINNNKFNDKLFFSLINPDAEVIINNYLFRIDFDKERTFATLLSEDNKNLKKSSNFDFSFDEDAFDILENGRQSRLKRRFCGNNKKVTTWEFNKGDVYNYAKLEAKVQFQRYSIYKAIMIKFNMQDHAGGLLKMDVHYVTVGENYYTEHRRSQSNFTREKSGNLRVKGNSIWDRPYSSTRNLKHYRVSIKFDYTVTRHGGGWPPAYAPTGVRTLKIACDE